MSLLFQIKDILEDVNIPLDVKLQAIATEGRPQQEFISAMLMKWFESPQYKEMKVGNRYFYNENDINNRKRYYIDRQGQPVETTLLANAKLSHPFMKKLVKQKVNYLLSKDFTVHGNPEYVSLLNDYFDIRFKASLRTIGEESIINGIAWLQVYYDSDGKLRFKHIPSPQIIPFWKDNEHTELDAVIRVYDMEEYDAQANATVYQYVEYYTTEGVYNYKRVKAGTGEIIPMDPNGVPAGHFTANDKQAVWTKIPFIAFKYNRHERSLIHWVKSLIDDYDTNSSDNSNNLQDIPNSVKIVKGYEEEDKQEFSKNLSTFRTVFVGEGGDVTSLKTELALEQSELHLERLRKDIYEFGGGVDQDKELRDVSGVALRFQYGDLDMDCSEIDLQFRFAMDQLIWFINTDIANTKTLPADRTYNIIFNTDVILNESETIQNLAVSIDMISEKTLLSNHPWVNNVDEEIKAVNTDRQKALQDELTKQDKLAAITSKYAKTVTPSNTKKSK